MAIPVLLGMYKDTAGYGFNKTSLSEDKYFFNIRIIFNLFFDTIIQTFGVILVGYHGPYQ